MELGGRGITKINIYTSYQTTVKAPSHYNELKERTVNEWQKS